MPIAVYGMISASRVSRMSRSRNSVDCAMKYDCTGSSSPSASSPISHLSPRNRYRLNAYAAAAEKIRINSTEVPVVITLLSAYWPMLPTSHAQIGRAACRVRVLDLVVEDADE